MEEHTTTQITLTSVAAIAAARCGADITLHKYADPVEEAADDITLEQALEIAGEDPELVFGFLTVPATLGYVAIDVPDEFAIQGFGNTRQEALDMAADGLGPGDPPWNSENLEVRRATRALLAELDYDSGGYCWDELQSGVCCTAEEAIEETDRALADKEQKS